VGDFDMTLLDLKHSVRLLRAHPGVTAIAILSMALGIGVNTTIFSVIYASLLRPLPYPDAERRVILFTTNLNSSNKMIRDGATTADFLDWRAQSRMLEDWQMFSYDFTVTATGAGLPERISNQFVTTGLLDSLGIRPVLGRLFKPGEEAENPAIISEGYWRRRFGGKEDVLGRKVTIDGNIHTIIGVLPANFELFDTPSVDLWNIINLSSNDWVQRKVTWLMATAKVKAGVTLLQAQSELSGIAAGLAQTYPESNRYRGVVVTPMLEARNGDLGRAFYPLFGAVGFVLLIACSNVANLLLALATARRREFALRAALGATRIRLLFDLLADGIVLAIPGVLAGLAFAYGGIVIFRAVAPQGFPGADRVSLNGEALLFMTIAGVLAGILSAIFPALKGSKVDIIQSLKEGARGSAGAARQRLKSFLVAGQIALALILLVAAGLMINTILRMQNHDLGFDPGDVVVARLHIAGARYNTMAPKKEIDMHIVEPTVARFLDHVLTQVRALPGVTSAAVAGSVPMGPAESPGVRFRIAGRAANDPRAAEFNVVGDEFFKTLRIPLLRGRYLNDRDVESNSWVAVVNETFAREYFPGGETLGQTITLIAGPGERPREIVGVVADFTQFSPRLPVRPEIYTSYLQQTGEIPGNLQGQRFRPKLILRSAQSVSPETIARIVADFDPALVVFGVKPLEQFVEGQVAPWRFYANILGFFSVIALLLAAVGIYGLMSYTVTDRLNEIGIRLALGASPGRIIWLIVSFGLKLTVTGLAVGVVGALWATRLLAHMLFDVKPWDPLTFSAVTMFVLFVALSACCLPALRAARVDPVAGLHRE
jgi:putative ABC transport system permease protein